MFIPIWSLPLTFSLSQAASHSQYPLSLSQATHSLLPPVSLPHNHPTKSFWTHGAPNANPLAREGSDGSLTTDVDVAIIGSGITGIGAVVHLARILEELEMGMNVVVLEARDFCEIFGPITLTLMFTIMCIQVQVPPVRFFSCLDFIPFNISDYSNI
jgi:hypothetical protein